MKKLLLKLQLRTTGANAAEADAMARIAAAIGSDVPGLSGAAKQRIADEIGFSTKKTLITAPRLVFASIAIIFVALLLLAQSAKPGQILYGLKRGSEQVRVIVQPGFNQTDLQERRAAEQVHVGSDTSTPQPPKTSKNDDKNATGSVQKRFDDFRRSSSGSTKPSESSRNSGSGSSESRSGSDDTFDRD